MTAAGSYTKVLIWIVVIGVSLYLVASFLGATANLCLAPLAPIENLLSTLWTILSDIYDFIVGLIP